LSPNGLASPNRVAASMRRWDSLSHAFVPLTGLPPNRWPSVASCEAARTWSTRMWNNASICGSEPRTFHSFS
jgi:hypothetical protein